MTSISLNQTESEKRLDRILYYVKFFRAMILHVVLLVQSSARKLGSLSVSEALGDSKQRYILYLRSFTADEIILPKPKITTVEQNHVFSSISSAHRRGAL
jgi:hypothetical protein